MGALRNTVILDVEDDVAAFLHLKCSTCGSDLNVTGIEDEVEHGITLEVEDCRTCWETAHRLGIEEERDVHQMGF